MADSLNDKLVRERSVFWVLVVDDREANRFGLRKSLEAVPGLEVIESESGEEALSLVAQVSFSLVLLDAQMPGIDGYEVARAISALDRRSQPPIIMLTEPGTLSAERAYAAGAVDYITKPVAPAILRGKVAQFLKQMTVKQQLAYVTEQQEAVLNAVGDGLMEIDAFGRIAYVNETALGLLGADLDGVEDTPVSSWFSIHNGTIDRQWLTTLWDRAGAGRPVTVPRLLMKSAVTRSVLTTEVAAANVSTNHDADGTVGDVPVEWTCARSRSLDGMLIVLFRDIRERMETEQRLIRLANYDPLTQLHNRAAFHDCLQRAIGRSARFSSSVALIMLDLDHFKRVNDTLGHDVGDQLLVEVGARLKALLRQSDTGARLGGDEFVLILEDTTLSTNDVYDVAERVVKMVAEPYLIDEMRLEVEASCGIALCHNGEVDLKTLVKRADIALYSAKSAGRNTFRLYHKHMSDSTEHNAQLERQIREMVRNEDLEVLYQPQISLAEGLKGFEACLHWSASHATELMSVEEFIHVAEQSSLIEQVGEFVLETVCEQMVEWVDLLQEHDLSMSISVSMRELANPGFAERVIQTVEAHDLDPRRIKLAITESAIPPDLSRLQGVLREFQAHGFRLCLDDFGTGYSSLAHLQQIAVDELKIDKHFISQLGQDGKNDSLVAAIIAMSGSFGLDIVAEGVENEDQSLWLRTMGCDRQQGHLFGGPVPPAEARQLIERFEAGI